MPIAPLSNSAARAICSSLTLNDSVSVVKELIDNGLDSGAKSVLVELSSNAIDVIQVKDDGVGIEVEDRKLLCKRGYTSKITTLEDLNELGGTSLGFRGEALASIAELSEAVVFTTRVEGETVGTLLKFDCRGELASSSSASHGTGTTVRVSNFLRNIPVRKQTALKHSSKILANVKRLLVDYAYARPTVRLQLKILKTPKEKSNWSFAPSADPEDLKSIATRIVPKDVIAQTVQLVRKNDDSNYGIAGLFASPTEGFASAGQYISIDGRPLSIERGFAKDLVKQYKKALKIAFPTAPLQPYLYLRLTCPRGSYDVNVDPAKNEVLLEHPDSITELLQLVYAELYHTSSNSNATNDVDEDSHLSKHALPVAPLSLHDLASQINRRTTLNTSSQTVDGQTLGPQDATSPASVEPTQAPGEDVGSGVIQPDSQEAFVSHEDVSEDIMNPNITNPFTWAKITARVPQRRPLRESASDQRISAEEQHAGETSRDRRAAMAFEARPGWGVGENLITPTPSPDREGAYQNPGPPNRPWRPRHSSTDDELSEADHAISVREERRTSRPKLLDDWMKAVNVPPTPNSPATLDSDDFEPSQRKVTMRSSPAQRTTPVSVPARSQFRPPLRRDADDSATGNSPDTRRMPSPTKVTKLRRSNTFNAMVDDDSQWTPISGAHSGRQQAAALTDIMEFERRKREAILQHRSNLQNRVVSHPHSSVPEHEAPSSRVADEDRETDSAIPPQPRSAAYTQNSTFNGSRSDGQESEAQKEPAKSTTSKDPRAVSLKEMNQLKRTAEQELAKPRAHRARISSLPLEKLHPEFSTFALTGHVRRSQLDLAEIAAGSARALLYDAAYVVHGLVQVAESDLQIADDTLLSKYRASALKHYKPRGAESCFLESDSPVG